MCNEAPLTTKLFSILKYVVTCIGKVLKGDEKVVVGGINVQSRFNPLPPFSMGLLVVFHI